MRTSQSAGGHARARVEDSQCTVLRLLIVPSQSVGVWQTQSSLLEALQKVGDGTQKAHYEQYADDPVLQHKHAKVGHDEFLEPVCDRPLLTSRRSVFTPPVAARPCSSVLLCVWF